MDILNTLINFIILGYLTATSYTDVKTRTISLKLSVIVVLICIIMRTVLFNYDMKTILPWLLYGCIAGIVLIILAFISKESLGYGDGAAVLIVGIGDGLKCALLTCGFAFILAAVFACFLLIRKKNRKATIPFLPFLCIGYILQYFAI